MYDVCVVHSRFRYRVKLVRLLIRRGCYGFGDNFNRRMRFRGLQRLERGPEEENPFEYAIILIDVDISATNI